MTETIKITCGTCGERFEQPVQSAGLWTPERYCAACRDKFPDGPPLSGDTALGARLSAPIPAMGPLRKA